MRVVVSKALVPTRSTKTLIYVSTPIPRLPSCAPDGGVAPMQFNGSSVIIYRDSALSAPPVLPRPFLPHHGMLLMVSLSILTWIVSLT